MVWDWLMSRYFFRCFFPSQHVIPGSSCKIWAVSIHTKRPSNSDRNFFISRRSRHFHHIMIYPPDVFFQHFCHWELGPVFPQKERDFRRPKLPAFFRKRAFKLRGGENSWFFWSARGMKPDSKTGDEHLVVGKNIVVYPRKNPRFWGISPEI